MASVQWFGSGVTDEYLIVYEHRDASDARLLAKLILESVGCPAGSSVLDVACGAGRHTPFFRLDYSIVGLDVSAPMLQRARQRDARATLVRADMRALPFTGARFDLALNLFTSFGYFDDDLEHRRAIDEIARVTRPGGWFVLDFLNAPRVRRTLVPVDRRTAGGRVVEERRRISFDGRHVFKSVRMSGADTVFLERVRLFEPADLVRMLDESSFIVCRLFGDYHGGPLTPDSPRAIAVARRAGGRRDH